MLLGLVVADHLRSKRDARGGPVVNRLVWIDLKALDIVVTQVKRRVHVLEAVVLKELPP